MNKVVHFELPAEDKNRAKKFYEDAFGWQIQSFDPQYYMIWSGPTNPQDSMTLENGFINGGIAQKADNFMSTMIVVDVDNIEESVGKVEAAGGMLVQPKMMIEHVGYYARVKDSEGNFIGLMQSLRK